MYQKKVLEQLFLPTLAYLIWAQVAIAEFDDAFTDGQGPPPAMASSGTNACPYNQICTGDMVLITMENKELFGTLEGLDPGQNRD